MSATAAPSDVQTILQTLQEERCASTELLRNTHAAMRMIAVAFNRAVAGMDEGADLACTFAEPGFDPAGGPLHLIAQVKENQQRFDLLDVAVRVVPCNRIAGDLSTFEALLPEFARGVNEAALAPEPSAGRQHITSVGCWIGVLHETVASGAADVSLACRAHRRLWRHVHAALENRLDSLADPALLHVVVALCDRIKRTADL